MIRYAAALTLSLGLAGCVQGNLDFPVTTEDQTQLPDDVEVILLTPETLALLAPELEPLIVTSLPQAPRWNYRVGTGDILTVIVFDHPELTLPAGAERPAVESGFRVQSDGTFFYPFIGQVQASGRPLEDIRAEVTRRLAQFIPSPQVEVRVAAFNSQSIVVTGEVNAANRQSLTTIPLTLIEAINSAGGLTDDADTRNVTVQRNERTYTVNLASFLSSGVVNNNPVLVDGDVVNVPEEGIAEAFVLGEVLQPNVVDLTEGRITLTQALARQGGIAEARADARGVFVFRRHGEGLRIFQVDATSPAGLVLGTQMPLERNDVIYVVRSPIARWNDTIALLLPTVQAINTVEAVTRNLSE